MYHKMDSTKKWLLVATFAFTFSPMASLAANTPEGCLRTVLKEAQKYAQKKANSMRKCEDGVLKGKLTSPCPDAKNLEKINKARTKAEEKIVKKCDDAAQSGFANCPRAACSALLSSAAELGTCVTCNMDEIVDTLVSQTYRTLEAPSADKDILNCQRTYAKEVIQAFRKVSKAYTKCEDGIIKGKIVSCPDAKATEKVTKFLAKLNEKIAKKCPDMATTDAAIDPFLSFAALGGTAGASGRVDLMSQVPPAFAIQGPACGNGAIDAGETCDDGNLAEENGFDDLDTCPADCSIASCTPSGSGTATVSIASPLGESIAGAVIVVYYDDVVVELPGSGGGVSGVTGLNGFSVTPNDANYALRNVIFDISLTGLATGDVFSFDYNECGAPATAGDFSCFVADASDTGFLPVDGVTCNVTP